MPHILYIYSFHEHESAMIATIETNWKKGPFGRVGRARRRERGYMYSAQNIAGSPKTQQLYSILYRLQQKIGSYTSLVVIKIDRNTYFSLAVLN